MTLQFFPSVEALTFLYDNCLKNAHTVCCDPSINLFSSQFHLPKSGPHTDHI